MCLILFAHDIHPRYRLVFAANRDEFYSRPSAAMAFWRNAPAVLAGRDLKAGGTWMGITRTGRLAAITNFRDPSSVKDSAPSRGHLVGDFLTGSDGPERYLIGIRKQGQRYNGFNLIAGDRNGLFYYGNRAGKVRRIGSGVFGLSNHLLDTPWPKVKKGRAMLSHLLKTDHQSLPKALFNMLKDQSPPCDGQLPDTGVGRVLERMLAPLFIVSADYGTRCGTVLLWERTGRIDVWERTFRPVAGNAPAEAGTVHFSFHLEPDG